jgi:signal transduction histidine kinase
VRGVQESADYQALGRVIDSIVHLASEEVETESEDALQGVDIAELLDELRLIITPEFHETGAALEWQVDKALPSARANHSGLLQVFMNLARNSRRALESTPEGRLKIAAYQLDGSIIIRFSDNGRGIPSTQPIFQPFQSGAGSAGLGLFVSRAVIRTFGGELHHTQRNGECCFVIELPSVMAESANA